MSARSSPPRTFGAAALAGSRQPAARKASSSTSLIGPGLLDPAQWLAVASNIHYFVATASEELLPGAAAQSCCLGVGKGRSRHACGRRARHLVKAHGRELHFLHPSVDLFLCRPHRNAGRGGFLVAVETGYRRRAAR